MFITVRRICLLLLTLLSSAAGLACELRVGVSGAFPPYHIADRDGDWQGIVVELVDAVASRVPCEVVNLNIPWDRSIEMLESGDLDMITVYSWTAERAEFSHFVGPIEIEEIVVLAAQDAADSLETLQALVAFDGLVGKTQGTFHGEDIEHAAKVLRKRNKLVDIAHNESRVGMLSAGRLDAIFENRVVADYLLSNGELDPARYAVALKKSLGPVYFGLSKRSISQSRLRDIQNAWQDVIESGELQAIYARYGLTPPPEILTLQPPQ